MSVEVPPPTEEDPSSSEGDKEEEKKDPTVSEEGKTDVKKEEKKEGEQKKKDAKSEEDDGIERTSSGKRRPKQKRKNKQAADKDKSEEPLELGDFFFSTIANFFFVYIASDLLVGLFFKSLSKSKPILYVFGLSPTFYPGHIDSLLIISISSLHHTI